VKRISWILLLFAAVGLSAFPAPENILPLNIQETELGSASDLKAVKTSDVHTELLVNGSGLLISHGTYNQRTAFYSPFLLADQPGSGPVLRIEKSRVLEKEDSVEPYLFFIHPTHFFW
jgi:hypothetical protein